MPNPKHRYFKHEQNGSKKLIIFSHGFGVRWNFHKMFPEIALNNPGFDFIFFDYIESDDAGNTYINSVEEQIPQYLKALEVAKAGNYEEINVISHSFGIVIPSMINSPMITKFIAIAPPPMVSKERQLQMLMSKPGGSIDLTGYSTRPRSTGTTTYVHYSYYDSLDNINVPELFKNNCAREKTVIIANQDEIVPKDYSKLENDPKIKVIRLEGNHNFDAENRNGLLVEIQKLLNF